MSLELVAKCYSSTQKLMHANEWENVELFV